MSNHLTPTTRRDMGSAIRTTLSELLALVALTFVLGMVWL